VFLSPIAALLICAAAAEDLRGSVGWLARRPLVYLGELSFCFYLTHRMVLHVLTMWLAGPELVTTALLVSVVTAGALHHAVEMPMQLRILSRRTRRPRREPVLSAA
jgi:peptidoglycan/LPS O-acetylase OafA/YrhL